MGLPSLPRIPDALRLGPRRFRRHVWGSAGRARIEVQGVAGRGDEGEQTASAVTAALRRTRGVRWAEVNAVTGHALVLFDQRRVGMGSLVEAVADVEDARDESGGWSRAEPPHPDDPGALTAATLALVADATGLLAALASRVLVVPPVPAATRAAVGIIEAQPRLRRLLEAGLGPAGTDAVVGVGSAVVNGLTGGLAPQAVTGLSHVLLVREVRSRARAWRSRGEAVDEPVQHPPARSARPVPFPPGPVELFADRVAAVSLAASGAVLTVTGDLSRAAKLLLIGVPPAARLGREAFAAVLARRLADRGVIPMDPGVFRRLDRVDTVLVDERLLDARWRDALDALDLDPDITVEDAGAGTVTAEQVSKLQADGRAVLVVAGSDNDVLAAADVAIAVPVASEPTGWAADLIAGSDAAAVATLLRAIPAARRLSRRAVLVSSVGTAVAGVATVFVPWDLGDLSLQPVYLAGLVTQLDGIRTARRIS